MAYIIGPNYSSNYLIAQQNHYRVMETAERLWRIGYAVACVHGRQKRLTDHEVWDGGLELLRRSDIAVLCLHWEEDDRCQVEHSCCLKWSIPTYLYTEPIPRGIY